MWNKYRKHSIRYLSLILIGIGVASTLGFGFADRDKSVESQVHSQETEPLKFNIGLERSSIGGGLYGFPLSSSLRLGRIIGAGFCRGCDALSELWWPAWSGSRAERSGLDRSLFERGWFSGRTSGYRSGSSSATARIGSGLLS